MEIKVCHGNVMEIKVCHGSHGNVMEIENWDFVATLRTQLIS